MYYGRFSANIADGCRLDVANLSNMCVTLPEFCF